MNFAKKEHFTADVSTSGILRRVPASVLLGTGLLLMAALASCEAAGTFFSTSWGTGLARDEERLLPKVNAGNALELAADTAGDKKKAKVVAEKIRGALEKTNNPAERNTLLKAGLIAAGNTSDLVMVVLANLNALRDPAETPASILGKIGGAGDVQASAALISGLLDAGQVKSAGDLQGLAQDDLALAALTLLLADAQSLGKMSPGEQEDYLRDFEQKKQNSGLLTDKQRKALVLASAVVQNGGPLTDLLGNLHLF